ncbi:MAG: hypothetical protein Q9220_005629 [cf. Caloplaca sp. 1 TL-2023]
MSQLTERQELDRWGADLREREQRRRTEAAHKAGFACHEDYYQHLEEESEKKDIEFQKYVDEQCVLTGKTREKVAEDYSIEQWGEQARPLVPWGLYPMPQDCDCSDHPFFLFCPQALEEFRSQDDPDALAYHNSLGHFEPEKITIEDGSKSKRLEQKDLEEHWERMEDQEYRAETPFWARADDVVQQIIQQRKARPMSASTVPAVLRNARSPSHKSDSGYVSPDEEQLKRMVDYAVTLKRKIDSGEIKIPGIGPAAFKKVAAKSRNGICDNGSTYLSALCSIYPNSSAKDFGAQVSQHTAFEKEGSRLHPSYPAPSLAPGYKAQLIATNLTKPRGLVIDSNGRLLVVEQGAGITALSIQDRDQGGSCLHVSQKVNVVRNSNLTHGITLSTDDKTLYASSAEAVFSWPYDAATSVASGTGENVVAITNTSDGDHITRTLLYAKKQRNTLIISRGSESNVDFNSLDLATGHCQIKSFPVGGHATQNFNTTGKLLGWGLRNSVGIAEHPVTGGIYSVEMGMDYATRDGVLISQNNPGDELNYHGVIGKKNDLDQGLNHGYPYCHAAWDVAAIPNRGDLKIGNQFLVGDTNDTFTANDTINDAVCARERAAPVITLPPHNAPIDLKFSADGNEAYISFHGSWQVYFNLQAPPSSKTAVIDIMSNVDVSKCGQIVPYVWNNDCFRPAGLAFDKAGRLYMSSDQTGEIWAITKAKNQVTAN